jgi:hypothetical protein
MSHKLLISLYGIFKPTFQNSTTNLALINNSINANQILSFTRRIVAHRISYWLRTLPDQFSYQIVSIIENFV